MAQTRAEVGRRCVRASRYTNTVAAIAKAMTMTHPSVPTPAAPPGVPVCFGEYDRSPARGDLGVARLLLPEVAAADLRRWDRTGAGHPGAPELRRPPSVRPRAHVVRPPRRPPDHPR